MVCAIGSVGHEHARRLEESPLLGVKPPPRLDWLSIPLGGETPPPLKSSVASPTTRRRCASLSQLKPPSSGSPRSARGRLAPKPRSVEAGG